jgi:hypothetical protein
MAFLPIVERELRVAARKRSTFWVRIIAALVALVIGSGFLATVMVGSGVGGASLGRGLFGTLTWLSLCVALSAGLFFTSDCLSEEKRAGTIGFLFLTDLRGYDVVLGKLLATSLRGSFALLAVFPILAITLLMGGVTGPQFWKTSLALVNALFVSLTAGLFVSAISRDSQKALAMTLFLLMVWVAAGPACDAALAVINQRAFRPVLSLSSPGYLFTIAGAWGTVPFWPGLLANQVLAWILLGLTCGLLPRTWQEKAAKPSMAMGSWAHWWKFGGATRRAALRRALIDGNPILWLACRERWQAASLWILSFLIAGGFTVVFARDNQSILWFLWGNLTGAVALALYLGTASHAGRFFVEAKSSGLLEVLLATRLSVIQIVQGQWRALVRMFGAPLAVCLAAQLLGTFLVQQRTWNFPAATAPPPASSTTTVTNTTVVTRAPATGLVMNFAGGFTAPSVLVTLATSAAGTLTVAANLAALAWFGMWMGLTSKKTNLAALKTIVFVQIIPWFVIGFASVMIIPLMFWWASVNKGNLTPQMMAWSPLLISGVAILLYLTKDLAFLLWARRKLYSELRDRAMQAVAPVRAALPPPLPRAAMIRSKWQC